MPMRPPRCRGSAGMVADVSAGALNSRSQTAALFCYAMALIAAGRVKTRWS